MPAAEFDLPAGHLDAPALPAVRFPEDGRPEAEVIDDVRGRFDEDRYAPDQNFSITYSGIPSAISQQVEALAHGRFFVEWARETELGIWSMEREAVAMMASLLGGDGGTGGFMTTGGTESNLAAMRSPATPAARPSRRSSRRSRCTSASGAGPSSWPSGWSRSTSTTRPTCPASRTSNARSRRGRSG